MLADDLRDRLRAAAPPGWRARLDFPLPFAEDTQRIPDVVVHRWPLQRPRDDERNPVGPADVGLIVEVVSPSTRRTDRFAKPGEYVEARIGLFRRLETEPDLVLHPFVLGSAGYEPLPPVRSQGSAPVPWGSLVVDLSTLGPDSSLWPGAERSGGLRAPPCSIGPSFERRAGSTSAGAPAGA